MRNEFADAIVSLAQKDERLIFLTGDLGFNALETVQDVMRDRFINTGVAEQNMMGVAAGLASQGLRPIVYSIAPFAIYRPFEQLRNDVCYHNLPVLIVGNGGGVAYGPMGFTHHALEDYGLVSLLPNTRSIIPAFAEDVGSFAESLLNSEGPKYLRLGRSLVKKPCASASNSFERILEASSNAVAIAVGTIANVMQNLLQKLPQSERPTLWVANEPMADLDPALMRDIQNADLLITAEEHVKRGSFAEHLNTKLIDARALPPRVRNQTYTTTKFNVGSENFIREANGFSSEGLAKLCSLKVSEA